MGVNLHVPINLEDGKTWLLRIPSFGGKPEPADVLARVRASEILNYQTLREAGVAVPEVYGWGIGTLSKSKGQQPKLASLMSRPMFHSYDLRKATRFPGF